MSRSPATRYPQIYADQVANNNARVHKAYGRNCGELTEAQWDKIKRRSGYKCACCGRPETERFRLTIDHIVPLSKGGSNTRRNVQPLCWFCNTEKGDSVVDYRRKGRQR